MRHQTVAAAGSLHSSLGRQHDLAMAEWEDPLTAHRSTPSASVGSKFKALFSDDEDDEDETGWSNRHNNPIMPSLASMAHTSSGFVDPLLTSTAYHIHQAESALSSLKQIIWEDDCDGWKKTLKHKKSGVVVHMKNGGLHKADKTPIFKGEAVIHGFSPQSVFYVIGMRKLWDEQYDDGNLVENLNETTSLTYEVSKPNPTSSINRPRDMALVEKIECTQGGAILFACTSVETPRVPRIQGRVRAQIKLQGWALQPIPGPTPATRVTYVIQENLKGWVPSFAKKSLARRPLAIALVNEYLQKKAERMRAQKMRAANSCASPPFASVSAASTSRFQSTRRPSLLANSSVSALSNHSSWYPTTPIVPQTMPSTSPSQRSSDATNANNTMKKRITFAEQDMTYSASPLFEPAVDPSSTSSLSNMSESSIAKRQAPLTLSVVRPHPLYPPHRHLSEKVGAMNLFKRLSASLDPWSLVEENNDIRIYGYNQSSRIPLIRIDSTVVDKWSAEQLCSAVQCFGSRKAWDDQFEEGRVLERFSQKDYLVHWCMRNQEGVSESTNAVTSIETDATTGVITTVTTSVYDTQQPQPSDAQPLQVDIYGWIFRPGDDGVHITWISSLATSNFCIPRLASYMNRYGCPPYIRRVAGKVTFEEFDNDTGTYRVAYIAKHEQQRKKNNRLWCTDIRIHTSRYPYGIHATLTPYTGTRADLSSSMASIRVYTTAQEVDGKEVIVDISPAQHNDNQQPSFTCNGQPIVPRLAIVAGSNAPAPPVSVPVAPQSPPAAATNEGKLEQPQNNPETTSTSLVTPPQSAGVEQARNESVPESTEPEEHETRDESPPQEKHKPAEKLAQARSSTPTPPALSPKILPPSSKQTTRVLHMLPEGYKLIPQQQNNNIIIISDELTFNSQQLAVVFLAMVLSYYMGKLACASSYC
ncbi:hypothetical protein BJV82DRAFT_715713 [Fennellomyces sp. T-0311]|nr:hypothetical protein BJV82DRAFT_715713 [Fennellomyces sp. T-0311]